MAENAQIDHFWRFEMFRARRHPLLASRALVDAHERVLRTLLAVNRVYYFGFKSLDAVFSRLRLAPARLETRIRDTYGSESPDAERVLSDLIEETYDLVEAHVPGVDVDRLRNIFRYRRPLWDNHPS